MARDKDTFLSSLYEDYSREELIDELASTKALSYQRLLELNEVKTTKTQEIENLNSQLAYQTQISLVLSIILAVLILSIIIKFVLNKYKEKIRKELSNEINNNPIH